MRLDLPPGETDDVDNPGGVAALRVDTGLELLSFENVALGKARKLVLCAEHPVCLYVENEDGSIAHINGSAQSLVPQKGRKPVCELSRFRPHMPMREVCSILAPDAPRDDNGAVLAPLGFAGMLWAGRLVPARAASAKADDALLEHLELRQKLSLQSLDRILDALYKQGYTPWQAEFPGMDLDFAEMAGQDDAARVQVLRDAVERYMSAQEGKGAGVNAREASIMLAPKALLPSLANADAPEEDVQLFTITLKPASGMLLVDVAAYAGGDSGK